MKDIFFFPLVLILTVSMVGLALMPGLGRLPTGPVAGDGVNYQRITVSGNYLNKVVAGGNAVSSLIRDARGQKRLYIEAGADALRPEPEAGPHFLLAADLEQQFSGMRVRCTVRLRPAEIRGAMQVMLNYSAGRVGESGWQTFDLVPGFTDVSFVYDVPRHRGEQGFDYFGIRPVVPEKSRAIIIDSIEFERLGPTTSS